MRRSLDCLQLCAPAFARSPETFEHFPEVCDQNLEIAEIPNFGAKMQWANMWSDNLSVQQLKSTVQACFEIHELELEIDCDRFKSQPRKTGKFCEPQCASR